MNVDCRWVDSNLEAVLSDQLDADQKSGFEQHLYTCERCRTEIKGYAKVDRLVGVYMDQQTARAYAVPRPGLSGGKLAAAAMAAAAVLAVVLWLPSVANQPATQAPPLAEVSAPEAPIAVADIDKAADAAGSERAKPGVDAAPAPSPNRARDGHPGFGRSPFLRHRHRGIFLLPERLCRVGAPLCRLR